MAKKEIVRKVELVEHVKFAGGEEYYQYPDGIRVPCRRVDELVKSSRLSEAEREALEEATGKDFEEIQRDYLHKQLVKEKAEQDAITKRIREEAEAQERARIQRAKDLFTAGHLIILKDGTQIDKLPPFDDEDLKKISALQSNYCLWLGNTLDEYQAALELKFIAKKYPGYLAIVTATSNF